jgi:hypothetical protein
MTWPAPTLETKLQEWLAEVTHMSTLALINSGVSSPSQLPAVAIAVAQSVCAEGNPPDCAQSGLLANLYGTMAELAFAQVPASQWNAATYTDTSDTPDVPTAPTQPIPLATTLFGVPVGDGRLNLSSLAIKEISAGTLPNGATAINPADGKSYALSYALTMAGMGIGGFWTPAPAAQGAIKPTS